MTGSAQDNPADIGPTRIGPTCIGPTCIGNDHLTVEVAPLGAELQTLATRDGRSWLWNGDPAFWSGRAPILFPIVGKAPENRISVKGRSFEMAQHGFARRSEFALAGVRPDWCRYELAASEATRAAFPFEFLLAVEYRVEGPSLTVSAEVENRDAEPMPFGFGFHPAFVWPLPGAEGRDHSVVLDNGAEPALHRIEGGLLKPEALASPFSAGRLVLDHSMFREDAMIFAEGAGKGLTYAAEGGPALKFSFENLPNLALWTKPGAPFLCVEPWHGMAARLGGPDDLAERPYALTLAPGGTARFAFTVTLGALC